MRQGQGQFVAALVVLAVVSLFWLMLNNSEFGAAPSKLQHDAPRRGVGGGSVSSATDRALLQVTLERYNALARNMTARIQTAEQALQQLRQAAVAAAAAKQKHRSGPPFRPDSPRPDDAGAAASASSGAAGGGGGGGGSSDDGGGGDEDEEETEEERAQRQEAEEKEQKGLIGYDESTKRFKRRWRGDFKCGDRVPPLPDNEVVECEPGGEAPCCSSLGWCGKSKLHCDCDLCQDYRSAVKLSVTGIHVLAEQRECSEIAYSFGPQSSPKACADLVLPQAECGRALMFSQTYPSWGCRCCAAGTTPSDEVKPDWTVYALDVEVQPAPGKA